jgi:hypothetical protein
MCMAPNYFWILEISIAKHLPGGQFINPSLLRTFEIFWDCSFSSFRFEKNSKNINREIIKRVDKTGIDEIDVHNFIFIGSDASADLLKSLFIDQFYIKS